VAVTVSTKHKAALVGVVSILLLAGCVTMTSPVPAGKDTYMMGLGARGFSSDADLLAQTIQSAGAFCTSQGRTIKVVSSSSSGVQAWTPQSNQVLFKCVPPTSPPTSPAPRLDERLGEP
jgi:hypothetical protein